ncbi:MAG: AraC family transcriptional regulator ligand-binding domain-containing protein [Pseudomonadota bacterium]
MAYPELPHSDYTHIENVRSLLRGCELNGVSSASLLSKIGVDPSLLNNSDGQFPRSKAGELLRAASTALQDEMLGFLPRKTRPGAMALAIHVVLGSSDLREAIGRWQAFWTTIHAEMDLSLEFHGEEAHLVGGRFWEAEDASANYAFVVWINFLQLRVFMWLIGRPILLERLCFDFPPPTHFEEFYHMFPTSIYCEQAGNHMVINRRYLQMPVVQTPKDARDFIRILPDLMTTQWVDRSVSGRVSRLLKGAANFEKFSFKDVAENLHLSPDTLRRRLKKEGVTFKDVKECIRRDLAIFHLKGNDLALTEIGYLLGFSEASTFSRAFKQWTGYTPGEFRKIHAQQRR